MSKVVLSPIKEFPGQVVLFDPLNMHQVLAWEHGIKDAKLTEGATLSEVNAAYLPGIIACVQKWELSGVPNDPTPDNFPMSPRISTAKLIDWLIGEISKVYFGEVDTEEKND